MADLPIENESGAESLDDVFAVTDLAHAQRRLEVLELRLVEARATSAQTKAQNEKLATSLHQMREQVSVLRNEVAKLSQPPAAYGTFLGFNDDGSIDINAQGRKMRVSLHPDIDPGQVRRGDEVVLNDSFNVVAIRPAETQGEVVTVKERLGDGRVVV